MTLGQDKKQAKRDALLKAAHELFLEVGVAKTSIEDITRRAKVAKGTFYLYFSDKNAVLKVLLGRISYEILDEAIAYVETRNPTGFAERTLAIADYIIEYMKEEPLLLKLIGKNLSWPSLQQLKLVDAEDPLLKKIAALIYSSPDLAGRDADEIARRFFVLVSMCASTCYSCIVDGTPDTIDNMKPVLYDIIRKGL